MDSIAESRDGYQLTGLRHSHGFRLACSVP